MTIACIQDGQIDEMADGALDVLERIGVLSQNDDLTRAMVAAGASEDPVTGRVRFPRAVMTAFIDDLRRENERPNSGDSKAQPPGSRTIGVPSPAGIGCQVAQYYHDDATGELRSANRRDFITLTLFGDALHGDDGVGHSLSLTDVPPFLEPLEAGLLLAEYARRPDPPFVWNAAQIDYLIEMGELLGRERWFSWGAVCFAHPLRFDSDTAGKFVRRVREGVPTGLTAMPVAGLTTPVTMEGFAVVTAAEHVATWFAARSIHPTVQLTGSVWAGTVDMRTGAVSYSAFDAMAYAFAVVEFLRRWCGARVDVGSGDYCDARKPGLYAALEKAHKAMTVSAFTGQPLAAGTGLLDEGRVLSPVQLLLDREFARGARFFGREIDLSEDRIGIEAILDVGVGLERSHLTSDHTFRYFRESLWTPSWIDRAGWSGPEDDARATAKALASVRDLLERYEKPAGREDTLAAMRKVLEKAKRELIG